MRRCVSGCLALGLLLIGFVRVSTQEPVKLGGSYASLNPRQQELVANWVSRFNKTTGQKLAAEPFYDDVVALSAKTTFEAITNALMKSSLTDTSGASLGDALSLVERIDAVHGQIAGARGDHQYRMYVRLIPAALARLERSREFKRQADNTIYHKGYPLNYREQGGTPSVQFSVGVRGRQADIDVDYRSSSFPAGLFNGHLTSSNSDVRAGNNYDRHANRWAGFRNWWHGFFGTNADALPDQDDGKSTFGLPATPRAGKQSIDVMAADFLTAWLIEGDVVAAMGYVSPRSYACLAKNGMSPDDVDNGVAPYRLMMNMKAARESLGPHQSLVGLTQGVRLPIAALKVVQQPHHAQFVVYEVPNDIAEAFACENRLGEGDAPPAERHYGDYFGTTFSLKGRPNNTIALLWGKEGGYWKVVSWQVGLQTTGTGAPPVGTTAAAKRAPADSSLVDATHDFAERWLIAKDYDGAFKYLADSSYACYDLARAPDEPPSASTAEAAQKVRSALQRTGDRLGKRSGLDTTISSTALVHPALRPLAHKFSRDYTLAAVPTALGAAVDCAARLRGEPFTGKIGLDYGTLFVMAFQLRSETRDAPVLRTLWRKDAGEWRVIAYGVETP